MKDINPNYEEKDNYCDMKLERCKIYIDFLNNSNKSDNTNKKEVKDLKKKMEVSSEMNILIGEKELGQMFKKDDFKKLKVLGQFNKGFIMATF